eukprot:CAMPEP_0172399864 /NCGR_PEP_ID=MMETSP1061-20121228/42906_1 /TAXON_ID=37318 /ORGANISM="Pseudo-nitzschia pungens, Strain cf. pungens" /LENGTH=236 /DNA_ID=CAMNT_0013132867 /DNA_START=50 /DNA_END=761 /DNA_ORIENTATION=+
MSVALKSLLLALVLGLCVPNALASGLRGAHESSKEVVEDVDTDEDLQSRRKLPPGQPNYGLTPSEHQNLYGYVDPAGYYGNYGYYDGGDYARFTYGNPWGDPTGTKDTRVHPEVVNRLGPKTITTTKTVAITKPVAITKTDTITKMATITKIPTPTTGHTTATTTAGTDVEDATTTTIPSKHPHWSFAAQKGEQSNSTTLQSHASQLVTIRLALSHWSCGYFRHLERDPDPCLPVQ